MATPLEICTLQRPESEIDNNFTVPNQRPSTNDQLACFGLTLTRFC